MASLGRTFIAAAALVAVAVACGISAVGQQEIGGTPNTPEAGSSASSGGAASSSGGAGDGSVPDAGTDARVDAPADAPFDGTPGCPAACNGGCDGGCNISGQGGAVACPPGQAVCNVSCPFKNDCLGSVSCGDALKCNIACLEKDACDSITLDCATSACSIRCTGGTPACNSVTVESANAASLCIHCNGSPGCNSVSCTSVLSCKKELIGSSNDVGGCVMCADGTCP